MQLYEPEKLPQGYYSSVGTVLLRRDSSREGQSLFLFLRDLGPRWVNAPGASGKKARFGGATEPLVWAEFNLYQSPHALTLQGAEVKEDFLELRGDPERLLTALRFYKRIPRVLISGCESNRILTQLWGGLVCLKEKCPAAASEFRFHWRLLHELGLAPSLLTCSECGGKLENNVTWSSDGLLCARCHENGEITPQQLLALQRAALLKHDQYIQWEEANYFQQFFININKKIVSFFANFN